MSSSTVRNSASPFSGRRDRPHFIGGLPQQFYLSGVAGVIASPAQQPEPGNAVRGILPAFDRFPVVALGMSHRQQDEADFSIALIQDPKKFAATVNDIVVECGNPLYQTVMDRYTAGAGIPIKQLQLWCANIPSRPASP